MAEPKPTESTFSQKSIRFIFFGFLIPITVSVLLYKLDSFEVASVPIHEFAPQPKSAPLRNHRMLHGSERIGHGSLHGPEDLAYDHVSKIIYTTCADGWIKRVTVNHSVSDTKVHDWVNTGGRPLGLALGQHNDVFVADAFMGLIKVSQDGKMELLKDEAEGLKFRLTDGIDVAEDGIVYFTDASYKYNLTEMVWESLEGRPYGRFMSFDPKTRETKVLVRDLYFANGVKVSPDQNFVIFCETVMRRCKKYYIRGEKMGNVDIFIDNIPGMPDNIRYDKDGQYWIALPMGTTLQWDLALRYKFIRKTLAILTKYLGLQLKMEKNGGVLAVDLYGKPMAHYYDPELILITVAIKIEGYLYCGSIIDPYIIRLNLDRYPALATIKY